MKKFIFFRTDRLGDYILITNIICALKKKYPTSKIIVIASQYNYNFIKQNKLINKVILFNKNFNLIKKVKIFKEIIKDKYHVSFSIDGKSFSNLCSYFLNSDIKLGLLYKSYIFGIPFYKPNLLCRLTFNKYEIFTSKKFLKKPEHLPSKLINLGNSLGLNINYKDKYFFIPRPKNFKKIISENFHKKYVLIHLDEKWIDIKGIDTDFYINLLRFQKLIRYNIVITSFNNYHNYFKNLKKLLKKNSINKIKLVENSNLNVMERLINYSIYSISCHSGFLVQIAGCNKTKIIDIINKKDLIWYSCWKPLNTKHKFVFKSNYEQKFNIQKILNNIVKISKKF